LIPGCVLRQSEYAFDYRIWRQDGQSAEERLEKTRLFESLAYLEERMAEGVAEIDYWTKLFTRKIRWRLTTNRYFAVTSSEEVARLDSRSPPTKKGIAAFLRIWRSGRRTKYVSV
jgi:hypothetical protein